MTDDLMKRLRNEKMGCNLWCEYYDGITTIPLCIEAADRIEKLEAALREIIGALDDPKGGQHVYDMRNASYIARKALDAE